MNHKPQEPKCEECEDRLRYTTTALTTDREETLRVLEGVIHDERNGSAETHDALFMVVNRLHKRWGV